MQTTSVKKMSYINVLTGSETSEKHLDMFSERRTVQVFIKIYASAQEDISDELDRIADTVENELAAESGLKDITESFEYRGTETDIESAANTENGEMTLEYSAVYIWQPTQIFPALEGMHIDIDMSSPRNEPQTPSTPDGQIDASLTIKFPTSYPTP